MLPLLSSIDESEVITLLQAGAGTVLLGCTLLALRHYLRPALTYRLYEHGVRVFDGHHHKERFIPFEKIGDIYRFRGGKAFGGLFDVTAFRAGADQPWCTVFSNVAHSWRLADVIVDQQLQQRGPLALNALYQGEVVPFHTVEGDARWLWQLLLGKRQGTPTETLRLSATLLATERETCRSSRSVRWKTIRSAASVCSTAREMCCLRLTTIRCSAPICSSRCWSI